MSFENLGLETDLQKNVTSLGYTEATPIQQEAIPLILDRKDVLARAQTGTGKTAAFALPILQLLENSPTPDRRFPRALVIAPTRELTQQVAQAFQTYGRGIPLKVGAVYGGVGISAQIDLLKRGVDILCATPGRLLDLFNQEQVRLANVEILVLDEADRMLDMGFIDDIQTIIAALPTRRQSLLFSATYTKPVMHLAAKILYRPEHIKITPGNDAVATVNQIMYRMNGAAKRGVLRHLIVQGQWSRVLIFTRTRFSASRLCQYLNEVNIPAAALHGNRSQAARDTALAAFKRGDTRVLVATDVAARGIHIDDVSHVVNFELPQVPEDYVHRIGRTGRAGSGGHAISLVCPEEKTQLKQIERVMHMPIPRGELKGAKGETVSPDSFIDLPSPGGRGARHRPSQKQHTHASQSRYQGAKSRKTAKHSPPATRKKK